MREYRAADDVTRGEFGFFVEVFHELAAFAVDEDRAFASEGFGDKCPGGAGDVECRGVELHEFEIAEDGARAVCHGEAVACCAGWVCGFAV